MYNKKDKVLLKNVWSTKFYQDVYHGPYTIAAVRKNGTVRNRRDKVKDTYNLDNITPYKE